MTIEAAGPALLRKGILNERDFDSLRQEFSRVETDAQFMDVANGIDCPRMPTAGEDHEALGLDIHNPCLIVMYHRVLLPLPCNTSVVDREALLKGSRAVDLSRH